METSVTVSAEHGTTNLGISLVTKMEPGSVSKDGEGSIVMKQFAQKNATMLMDFAINQNNAVAVLVGKEKTAHNVKNTPIVSTVCVTTLGSVSVKTVGLDFYVI